jgi:hypothetical protein
MRVREDRVRRRSTLGAAFGKEQKETRLVDAVLAQWPALRVALEAGRANLGQGPLKNLRARHRRQIPDALISLALGDGAQKNRE